jgi:hypothetical protein
VVSKPSDARGKPETSVETPKSRKRAMVDQRRIAEHPFSAGVDTGEGGLERGKGAAVDSPGPADGIRYVKLLTAG